MSTFKTFEGPTMNAFEAAEKECKAESLQQQLEELFAKHNTSVHADKTVIPATYLQVTVKV